MIKLFEMFSGFGGASFALQKANIEYECVGISEIDKKAIICYNNNHPGIKNYGDCSKIIPEELPDFDLLTGGFPCQDVSMAGQRNLKKGRTNLYKETLRIANVKRPKYMILENVRGILSMKENDMHFVQYVVADLKKIGYDVFYKVMNSKDYGIPQNRERVWFICKLGKWNFNEFTFPTETILKLKLKDLLEEKIDERFYMTEKQSSFMFAHKERQKAKGNGFGNLPQDLNSFCMCLMAANGTMECTIKYIKIDDKYRRLTPVEYFRLMGFLHDEIILDDLEDKDCYKLAGNGWDINVASKIMKQLFKG